MATELIFIALVIILAVLNIGGIVLWIWMLIDCVTNEPSEDNNKIVWILVIALAGWIGALIYLFVRRPRRKELIGQ